MSILFAEVNNYICFMIFSNISCLIVSLLCFTNAVNTPFKITIIDNYLMLKLHVAEKNKACRVATNGFLMKSWGNLISLLNLYFQEFKTKLISSSVRYWFCYSVLRGSKNIHCVRTICLCL